MARYSERFATHGLVVGQVLLTVDDVTRRSHYRNAYQTFAKLLELGVVPVVNENDTVATSEIRFGDNDRLAALVAHLVHADLLVLLSDVDGLYDGPPGREGSALGRARWPARPTSPGIDIGRPSASAIGTGGMVTKVEAARIATGAGIPVVLTAAERAAEALAGDAVGTRFLPTGRRRPTRLLWLAHASETQGALHVDDGAVRALTSARRRCCRPASPASPAPSPPATRSTSWPTTAPSSPAAWSTTTAPSCPSCSAARPASSPPSSAPTTSVRSCTATTWSSSVTERKSRMDAMKEQVHEAARRARLAATDAGHAAALGQGRRAPGRRPTPSSRPRTTCSPPTRATSRPHEPAARPST